MNLAFDHSRSVLIVLAAGTVTQDFVSVFNATTPALLPYEGRPLIYQTIVNHLRRCGRDVIIALPDGEPRLEQFLRAAFRERVNLLISRVPSFGGSPTDTLRAVINEYTASQPVDRPAMIVHGDIYFEETNGYRPCGPTAYVQPYIESDKYSYFYADGDVTRHALASGSVESQACDGQPRQTDIGAYWVPSLDQIKHHLSHNDCPRTVGGLLSEAYKKTLQLCADNLWCDLGHLDSATQIRTRLIGSREFNSLSIDERRGIITKRSTKATKLLQEINYYNRLPRHLSIYFPRLHEVALGKCPSYSMEFYSYRTLSEYLVFFEFPASVWRRVLEGIFAVTTEFAEYLGPAVDATQHFDFYCGKLQTRMSEIAGDAPLREVVDRGRVVVNGVEYRGWRSYVPAIEEAIVRMGRDYRSSVVHGDLCFSNILYDPQTGLLKLIDPRGEFFEEGCFGDPRYDLAKLLHSFHGGYDFILHEMYDLTEGESGFKFTRFRSKEAEDLGDQLLEWLAGQTPFPITDLLILEAMLFLSMLPLHSDDPKRQVALYLVGLQILDKVFK